MFSSINLLENKRFRQTIVDSIRLIRGLAFTKERHQPQILVEAEEACLVKTLGRAGYVHPWVLSYNYRGEDRNLARFFYDYENHPRFPYRQDHIRLYVDEYPPKVVGLAGHTEPSSVNHRQGHLKRDAKIQPAIRRIKTILQEADLDYRDAPGWSNDSGAAE